MCSSDLLRWARTFRTLRPVTYFCSLFTYGLPLSILWLAASSGSRPAWVAIGLHVGLRALGRVVLYRSLGQPPPWSDTWLVPIRDAVSFVVVILSFLGRQVRWNDERLRVRRDGRLERRVRIGGRPDLAGPAEVPAPASEWEESA